MATAGTKLGKGKTGSGATNTRALVRRVSETIETHTGTPLKQGKRELDFSQKLGKLADPPIGASLTL